MVTYAGGCFCDSIALELSGEPIVMGFCHCDSCKSWSGSCVQPFALWTPGNVRVIKGEEQLGTFNKSERAYRNFCTKCGGHVMTALPLAGMVDVFPSIVPTLQFAPRMHIFYGEMVLKIADGLPKFKDLPANAGGSGETVPE